MLALALVAASCLWLIGQRADRIHAQRVGGTVTNAHLRELKPRFKFANDWAGTDGDRRRPGMVEKRESQTLAAGSPETAASRPVPALYRHHSAAYWAGRYRTRTRQLQTVRAHLNRQWRPTVRYALRLASAVTGVPYTELAAVAWCESRYSPFAQNGRYLGLFQLGWAPLGFSPFDPVANALSAALTVRHDGSWRQWECKP